MKRLWYIGAGLAIIGLLALLAVWQQRQMVRGLPPRHVCANELEARALAGPSSVAVLGTGSMAPYIAAAPKGANPLVTVVAYAVPSERPFKSILKGDLVIYQPRYSSSTIMHQAAQKDASGWIMSGLHNRQSESFARVTEKEFVCIIGEVYTW